MKREARLLDAKSVPLFTTGRDLRRDVDHLPIRLHEPG